MDFAGWLAWRCERAQMTQADLVRAISAHPGPTEVTRQAVSRWFKGSAVPSAPSLITVCDALDIGAEGRAQALRLVAAHTNKGAA